jgi:glycerol kinase
MTKNLILAIDQGTTSSKAMLVDSSGLVVASGSCPLGIGSPKPGWVEQDAHELWTSVLSAVTTTMAGCPGASILGVTISNQRESVVAWDAGSGQPVGPAISWQDQRGGEMCRALATTENAELVRLLSGLELGSMFSASKIAWFADHYGSNPYLRVGTVDTWLLDRLTGGAVYATEAGNASRTLLFDIEALAWSRALGELFGVDVSRLAEVRPSTGPWGGTWGVPGIPDGTPILAVLGDSHAALYGHWALAPDHRSVGKATYGTGSSVMLPADRAVRRVSGVGTTLAWRDPAPLWALEGNILYSGAGMDWLARTLGVKPGADFSQLASTAGSSRRAVFVPALNGLGAPWWEASAVGTLTGLDSATTRAEIALAGIEAVAHQICDVVDAMDPMKKQDALHAGGGATSSQLLMQTQADLLGRTLLVSSITDISALGVAALGFNSVGVAFAPQDDLKPRAIEPSDAITEEMRLQRRATWRDGLSRAGVRRPAG